VTTHPTRRAVLAGAAATTASLAAGGTAAHAAAASAQKHDSPLWTFEEVALVLIDYQPETFTQLRGPDPRLVELNARLLARSAKSLGVPVVLSTVGVTMGINHPTVAVLLSMTPGWASTAPTPSGPTTR
jgi:hypothetical protein